MKSVIALVAVAAWLAPAQKITLEDTIRVRQLQDLRFSPDGGKVAFVVQEPPTGRRAESHIWIFATTTGELRQWTASAKSERMPRWSPDGSRLAFLSDREEANEIWTMPAAGGEAVRLTTAKQGIQTFAWSRDGRTIAFLAAEPKAAGESADDPEVLDRVDRLARVWVMDVATKQARKLTSGAFAVSELEWFPDGQRLAIIGNDRPFDEQRTEQIYSLGVTDGALMPIVKPRGPFRALQVSPGGGQIAWLASAGDGPTAHDLHTCGVDNCSPRDLTEERDRPVQSYQWRGEGELAALFADGFRTSLGVAGERPGMIAADGDLDIAAFAQDSRGALVTVQESAVSPAELYWQGKAVSHFNDGIRALALVAPEFYRYTSFDGVEIEAALYRVSREAGRRPLVLLIHGGPAGNWRNRFDGLTQLLLARGYNVMQPNIRGSIAYGQKFLESNRGDWGGGDYKDAMAGVDDLIKRGIADADRLAIAGWSYGGYMAEWAITQTDRFKAAVSGAGMADLAAEFGTEIRPEGDEWYYRTPYENPAGFQKSSPITFIKNAKTPTLILQGEADTTDPLSQSQILYRGLKRYKVPVEMVVYPREPHGFREEKHILDRDRRIVEWIAKYVR